MAYIVFIILIIPTSLISNTTFEIQSYCNDSFYINVEINYTERQIIVILKDSNKLKIDSSIIENSKNIDTIYQKSNFVIITYSLPGGSDSKYRKTSCYSVNNNKLINSFDLLSFYHHKLNQLYNENSPAIDEETLYKLVFNYSGLNNGFIAIEEIDFVKSSIDIEDNKNEHNKYTIFFDKKERLFYTDKKYIDSIFSRSKNKIIALNNVVPMIKLHINTQIFYKNT